MRPLAGLLGLLALLAATPACAQVKKFKEWIAGCDNQRNCAAYSLKRGSYHAYLKIERDGTPSADATVTVAVWSNEPLKFRFETDAAETSPYPEGTVADPVRHRDGHYRYGIDKAPEAVAAFVRKATKLTVLKVDPPPKDENDEHIDNIYLAGAHDALAWIDAQQKRVGTETAFVRRGPKSRETIPPQPALPVITAAKPDSTPVPAQNPSEIVARANATCGKEQIDAEVVKTVRLGGGFAMYWFFCGQYSGSANLNHAFLLAHDGKAKQAVKPRFVLAGEVARHIKLGKDRLVNSKTAVFNPEFNAEKQQLSSFFAGRSASDCGEITEWVWNGREFHVKEFSLMPDCEGIPSSDFPALYRAQVKPAP
jgi:Protein of unknown function (DUF1176)